MHASGHHEKCPRPRWQRTCAVQASTTRLPSLRIDICEGDVVPRSDSTERCLLYVLICYMSVKFYVSVMCLVLAPSYILFMSICVITYYFKVGGGTWDTVLYTVEVWVLGVGMSTPGAQTALYAEDRGLQVPMSLDHGPVTSRVKVAPDLIRGSDIGFR